MWCAFVLAAGTLLWAGRTFAAVRVAKIFGDDMVLQRDMAVPIWGWANSGEKITVRFADQEKTATADASGKWIVRLDAMPASKTPRDMTISGENILTLKDVLVGEVWLCSGQSNMEFPVQGWSGGPCLSFDTTKSTATNSAIRQIEVDRIIAPLPVDDLQLNIKWTPCSPETVGQFSAVAYFFGREIAKQLDVPVGLINDSWGGTRIEPWTPPQGFQLEATEPEIKDIARKIESWNPMTEIGRDAYKTCIAQLKAWIPSAEAALDAQKMPPPAPPMLPAPKTGDNTEPTVIFNAMIAPIIPVALRGAIWYQGESNGGEGVTYLHKTRALVGGWRQLWGEGDFPFFYVQLAGYQRSNANKPAGGDGWARLREAQLQALSIPNTGMAVIIDIGNADDVHPRDKEDVGHRLAVWALAKTYGKDVIYSGPLYKSFAVEGNKIRVSFDSVGSGLIVGEKKGLEPVSEVPGGKLKWFAVAGADQVWHWADAVIDGATVLVSSPEVSAPVAVRYAFAMNPDGADLYNREGLPASPFRTDDWK